MKITTRCGEQAIEALNDALLAKANEATLVKTGKVRADTTVVSANVEYPTDTGLLARVVTKIGGLVRRIKATGAAGRTRFRDRSRAAGRRVRAIASKLRLRGAAAREEAQAVVVRVGHELAGLAEAATTDAVRVLINARRAVARTTGPTRGRLRRAINELTLTIQRAARIVARARTRLAGGQPDSATRLVSLHDPDARPIAKGRLGKPIEFGYKAQVVDNEDGTVVDYTIEQGNPPDGPQLAPAIKRITARTGKPPRAATADRGYGEAAVEKDLHDLGVRTVAIPRKGQTRTDPAARRTSSSLPQARQVAHRQRRSYQPPQTP
jgi:IS5 family transposase